MDRDLSSSEIWRTRLRRSLPWLLGAAVLFAGVSAAVALLGPSVDLADLTVATVDRGPVRETIETSGRVVPTFEIVLSSPVEARVQRIVHTTGDTVEAGETIVELDTSQARLSLEQVRERIAQKKNERARLENEIAEDQLATASSIERKELDAEIIQYRAEQNRKLREEGLISEEQARQSEVEAKKATIELDQLRGGAQSSARTNEAKLAGVDLELSILRKELDQSARQLELAAMKAPRAGVVTFVVPQEGATVGRGEVLARVADLTRFRIEGQVSDIHASRLAPGMEAVVSVGEKQSRGTIVSVDPTVRNGVVTFLVDPTGSGLELRNNLRVDVHVIVDERPEAVRLPRGPGITDQRRQAVFVLVDDHATRTPIEVGLTGYDYVEVTRGLQPGDQVIVSDIERLSDAEQLRVHQK